MRLLIAEDDPVIALGLEHTLVSLGHEVVARVDNGQQAIEATAALSPDAIVMDLMMPGVDGLSACRTLSAERRVPVVALTAYDNPDLVEEAIAAGVSAYLVKPVSPRQVDLALRLAVSRHEEFEAMRAEVGRLAEALETRKLVERAKGILMSRSGLSESEAFARIQRRARNANRRLAEVARQIIEAEELLR
jgi:AmiR/NasT family two-component response regulator